jgi:recombination protein RecA
MDTIEVIPTGSTLLDLVLNGGYPLGQIINVAGLKSTGKTLLAIEAAASFSKEYPEGKIRYLDAEAAFEANSEYALKIGFPTDRVDMAERPDPSKPYTVEFFSSDLTQFIHEVGESKGLYILDSMDALSTEKEAKESEEKLEKTGYGTDKAYLLSMFFRNKVAPLKSSQICLFIVRQQRENVTGYGPKYKTSGGIAADFYANQAIEVKKSESITKTIKKDEATIGVNIKLYCHKNKIGKPFRDCEVPIIFDYGIDDLTACLQYLEKRGELETLTGFSGWTKNAKQIDTMIKNLEESEDYKLYIDQIRAHTRKVWQDVQDKFLVNRRPKY